MTYRGTPYWETEKPEEAGSERVLLSWFTKAGKLQVASLFKTPDGQLRRAKVVTLDAEDVELHPDMAALLRKVAGE